VLVPDINESYRKFTVNNEGNIRFGLAAIKNVGAIAVDIIAKERNENGMFTSIFDFVERINLTAVNKRSVEAMVFAGAFDRFKDVTRAQFLAVDGDEPFIDSLLRYGAKAQIDKTQNTNSLFGGGDAVEVKKPKIPKASDSNLWELLKKEQELIGMYLSAHPLDTYRFEVEHFATHTIQDINDFIEWKHPKTQAYSTDDEQDFEPPMVIDDELGIDMEDAKDRKKRETLWNKMENRMVSIAGIIIAAKQGISKQGTPWGRLTVEDYSGSYEFSLFGKDYEKFLNYFQENVPVIIRCKIQESWRRAGDTRPAEWEARIQSINLLSNAKDDIKTVTLTIPVTELTSSFVNDLTLQLAEYKGNAELRLQLVDTHNNISTEVFSRSHRITPVEPLLSFFEHENIKIQLN